VLPICSLAATTAPRGVTPRHGNFSSYRNPTALSSGVTIGVTTPSPSPSPTDPGAHGHAARRAGHDGGGRACTTTADPANVPRPAGGLLQHRQFDGAAEAIGRSRLRGRGRNRGIAGARRRCGSEPVNEAASGPDYAAGGAEANRVGAAIMIVNARLSTGAAVGAATTAGFTSRRPDNAGSAASSPRASLLRTAAQ
jgi:hypothetical protein